MILSAEKSRNRPRVVPHQGLPQARKTINSVNETAKGIVFGYISSRTHFVIEITARRSASHRSPKKGAGSFG